MTPPGSPNLPTLVALLGASCVALVTWATVDLLRRVRGTRRFG